MTAITLRRTDPCRNLHRYYRMIGGQIRSVPYSTPAEVKAALVTQCRAKERRGYA